VRAHDGDQVGGRTTSPLLVKRLADRSAAYTKGFRQLAAVADVALIHQHSHAVGVPFQVFNDIRHICQRTRGVRVVKQNVGITYTSIAFSQVNSRLTVRKSGLHWVFQDQEHRGNGERRLTSAIDRDLEVLLSFLLNKQLKSSEVIVALGISRSAYYDQKQRGELTTPTNLVAAAQYFGLNPLDLLCAYQYVSAADIEQSWQAMQEPWTGGSQHPTTTTKMKGGKTIRGRRATDNPEHHLGSAI